MKLEISEASSTYSQLCFWDSSDHGNFRNIHKLCICSLIGNATDLKAEFPDLGITTQIIYLFRYYIKAELCITCTCFLFSSKIGDCSCEQGQNNCNTGSKIHKNGPREHHSQQYWQLISDQAGSTESYSPAFFSQEIIH